MKVQVKVDGLDELQAGLRKLGADMRTDSPGVTKAFASAIAEDASSRAQGIGGVAGHVAGNLKVLGNAYQPSIKLSAPPALGAEFGALRYGQFASWTGSGEDAGYFLFPAAREATSAGSPALDAYIAAVQEVIDSNIQ